MKIKQDPVTKLWAREDGAVLMPPNGFRWKKFRWTFGNKQPSGYLCIRYKGKQYYVHRLVCRAFYGMPPAGKPQVDHINRLKDDNHAANLHWVDNKENQDNKDYVDKSIEKYGVRHCDDKRAYNKAYDKDRGAAKRAKMKAQGLSYHKGPDGKFGWYPRVRKSEAV